jgi:hypothetical protein
LLSALQAQAADVPGDPISEAFARTVPPLPEITTVVTGKPMALEPLLAGAPNATVLARLALDAAREARALLSVRSENHG